MLAVSLLALIIVGLLAMFYQVQRAFRLGTAQADVMEGGRATMSLVMRGLMEMAPTQITDTQVQPVTNCLIVPSEWQQLASPDASTVQLLPSQAARLNYLRDLCYISRVGDDWYATAYRISNAVSGVGTLYRMVEHWTNNSNPELTISDVLVPLSHLMVTSRVDHPSFHQVVDGVVHFSPLPCNRFGQAAATVTNAFRLPGQAATDSYAFTNTMLPAYIDLELAVLEPGAVEKFRARASIDPARATNFLATQIGRTHVFRQRVAIQPGQRN